MARAAGRRASILVCLSMLLAACSGAGGQQGSASAGSGSATATQRAPAVMPRASLDVTPTPTGSPTRLPGRVTLAFAGDVHFERQARYLLREGPVLAAALRDTIGKADFSMVNLETAIGSGGRPMPGKQYTFRAPATALTVLAGSGVDAVSMANNHAVDFGAKVFAQTLEAKAHSPIPVVGIGKNAAEAFTPLVTDVGGVRIAVLGSSQVRDLTGLHHAAGANQPGIAANLDMGNLMRAVRQAVASNDVVVVMMHWGTEYTTCADDRQRETARRLARAGADVVVGGHGHRPQGSGWLGTAYIGYGLGNFIWYNNGGGSESGVLTLTVDATYAKSTGHHGRRPGRKPRTRPVVSAGTWTPMLIGTDGVPRRASGQQAAHLSRNWVASAKCGQLAKSPPRSP